jgi:hypothetical protein
MPITSGIVSCKAALRNYQHHHQLLWSISNGRKGIGGKNRQTNQLTDSLVRGVCGLQRSTDQPGTPTRLGHVLAGFFVNILLGVVFAGYLHRDSFLLGKE